MFKDAEVDGSLVRLDAPGDGVVTFDIDPSDEIGLFRIVISIAASL